MTTATPIRSVRTMSSKALGGTRRRLFWAVYAVIAVLGISGAPSIAFSDGVQPNVEPPLYPSIITTVYHGKTYPIIGVSGEVPQIKVDGKMTRLGSDQQFQTPRA